MPPPQRAIFTPTDLQGFIESPTYADLNTFIRNCAASINGCKNSDGDGQYTAEHITKLSDFMVKLEVMVDEIPPIEQSMRFGNKAFKLWHAELKKEIPIFLSEYMPADKLHHAEELGAYLGSSFGNEIRLDYGTGHESFLVIFLFCLHKIDIVATSDLKGLILSCFTAYMKTVRKLQTVYLLEPAGSHGVWGLDDYQCLVFLLGAAQLKGHPEITPSSIHDDDVLEEFSSDYLYLGAIRFIKSIKHGAPFAETSSMLNDISYLADWGKVYNGLTRLYDGEVLNKFPVAQHFLFGDIFCASWTVSSEADRLNASHARSASSFGIAATAATTRPSPVGAGIGRTVFTNMSFRGTGGHSSPALASHLEAERSGGGPTDERIVAPWPNNHNV